MSWNNESNPWIVVPDPTAHIQGSSGVRASMGPGCLGSKKGGKLNIWHVVMLLDLKNYTYAASTHIA